MVTKNYSSLMVIANNDEDFRRGRQQSWCFSGHNFSLSFGKRFLSQIWRLSINSHRQNTILLHEVKKKFCDIFGGCWESRAKENSISSKLSLDGKSSGRRQENFLEEWLGCDHLLIKPQMASVISWFMVRWLRGNL